MAYTAGDLLVRALLFSVSGLPADTCVNDWAFKFSGTPTDSDITNVFAAVDGFYNNTQASGGKVGGWIGEQISRSVTHELQAYTIVAGPLGSPRFTADWLGPPSPISANNNLPNEVAGVLSFHADTTGVLEESGATRPRARRRGRVYIGPLIVPAVDYTQDVPPLESGFRTTMQQAAVQMAGAADADGWTWSVWSRADAVLRPVVGGWTDNAPDTQRRRGFKSTSRSTFTV